MSPAATSSSLRSAHGQPLQYFIHYDYDALRMEISGSLVGRAAQNAYEALRTAGFLTRRKPLVVDISYVTEADEQGTAVLRAWHEQDARIVALSAASRAIADSSLSAPVPSRSPEPTLLDRLVSLLSRRSAGNAAGAEATRIRWAGAKQKCAENDGFRVRDC